MVKRTLLKCCVLCVATLTTSGVYSQKNSVTVGGGLAVGDHETFGFAFTLDYVRDLPHNFSAGVFAQQVFPISFSTGERYMKQESLTILSAMGYYDLPVVKRWLLLRMGAGAGAGYHVITYPEKRVLPYFTGQMQWVVRTRSNIEMKFAPLLIYPSRILWSPMGLGAYAETNTYNFDLLSFAIGGRF